MTTEITKTTEITNHCNDHSLGTLGSYTVLCQHCYCKRERCCASPTCERAEWRCCKCGALGWTQMAVTTTPFVPTWPTITSISQSDANTNLGFTLSER